MSQSVNESASLKKFEMDGLDAVSLSRACCTKYFITAYADPAEAYLMFKRLGDFAKSHDAKIFEQYVFGGCKFYEEGTNAIKKSCGPINWPVTWIEGDECSGEDLTATQAYAITGDCYKPLVYNGKAVGAIYEDDDALYCRIGDLKPDNIEATKKIQAREVFDKMEDILKTVGMDFTNVVRTWMYLNDLLTWYDDFNEVRNTFFQEKGIFGGVVPASTGIGVCNPAGAALVTDLLAVKPKTDRVKIEAIPSPLQCPALDYKSSFSRAVEVALPDHRTLYISGTASIEPGGKSVHIDDIEKQIALTMEVTHAILKSRKMDFSNTVRGIAYFKDITNAPVFKKYCKDKGLPRMPFALSHSDVCRDDLLFEIELDAIKIATHHTTQPILEEDQHLKKQ